MKKILLIFLSAAMILVLTACSSGGSEEGNASSASASDSSEPSSQESITKLEKAFGSLYAGDEYSVSALISVVSKSAPDDVSRYELQIAADNANNAAMMYMKPSQGEIVHIVIKDGSSYNINDEQNTCAEQNFTDKISSFTSAYTTELYLGITENLELADSGREKTEVEGKKRELDYEVYHMAGSDDASQTVSITYYFDNDTPVMELMESSAGRTTFVFREVSDKISDRSVFEVKAEIVSSQFSSTPSAEDELSAVSSADTEDGSSETEEGSSMDSGEASAESSDENEISEDEAEIVV